MVDDILLSPEEQDERARQWLKDNGPALLLGIVLGLGAVFGYQSYQQKLITDAESASAIYETVIATVQQSEFADITASVDTLKSDYAGTSYAAKAVLLRARQLSVSDLDAAAAELAWVTDNSDEIGLQHTARIRHAMILLSQDKLDEARALATLDDDAGFASNYQEILGDIAARQQQGDLARQHYQSAIDALGAQDASYRAILNLKRNRVPVGAQSTAAAVSEPDAAAVSEATAGAESAEVIPESDSVPATESE